MKKYLINYSVLKRCQIVFILLLSFNSYATSEDDLNKYQSEFNSIMSQQHVSPKDQMLANNENDSIIEYLSKTKDFNVIEYIQKAENENEIKNNLKNFKLDNINNNNLTGKQLDACGAILCLSSSVQPAECGSYLTRYFSIKAYKHKKFNWGRTVKARQNFLKSCPLDN